MLIDPGSKKKTPVSSLERLGGVSVKRYRQLLKNAGMTHRVLTKKPVEIDLHENVSPACLHEVKIALEHKMKNDESFIKYYVQTSDEKVKKGVAKLKDFLYAY